MQGVADILTGDGRVQHRATEPRNKQLDDASRELVGSVFYGTLLKTMRQSEIKGKYGHGGRGEEAFASQLDAQFAKAAGQATRGGLADAIYDFYQKQQMLIERGRDAGPLEVTA